MPALDSRKALWVGRLLSIGGRRWLAVLAGPRCPLHRLSDHLLRDVGLSRADVRRDTRGPIWPR